MTGKDLLLKTASVLREQDKEISELRSLKSSIEKRAKAEGIAFKMYEKGAISSVEDYRAKIEDLSSEGDLSIVERAVDMGITKNAGDFGKVHVPDEDLDGSQKNELTEFFLGL